MKIQKLTGIALMAICASAANANLLVNGDFENMPNWGVNGDGSYTLLTGNQIPGWNIEQQHGATVHKNPGAYPTISGAYSINMDGEGQGGLNCDMFQDFASSNGAGMTLEFDHLGWLQSSNCLLDVSITDMTTNAVVASGTYDWTANVVHESQTFVGTGNVLRLRVKEAPQSGFNDNKFIVDNFQVEAVPEPASMAALGMGALALIRRRRS